MEKPLTTAEVLAFERRGNGRGAAEGDTNLDGDLDIWIDFLELDGEIVHANENGSPRKTSAAAPAIPLSPRLIVTVVAENGQLFRSGEIDFDEFKKRAHVEFHDFSNPVYVELLFDSPQPIGAGR